MDDKSRLFTGGIITHIVYPFILISDTGYFGIGNLYILMASVRFDTRIVELQSKIVCIAFLINEMIVLISDSISRRNRHENESLFGMSRQSERTVFCCLYHIKTVRNQYAWQGLFTFVKSSVIVTINIYMSCISSCGCKNHTAQQDYTQPSGCFKFGFNCSCLNGIG